MEQRTVVCFVLVALCVAVSLARSTHTKRQADGTIFPAFSAGLTSMLNVTDKSDVIYDRVFLNLGAAYNVSSGAFTAPYNGTYLFMFHGLGETNGQLWLELLKNEQYVTSAYAHVTSNYAAASNVIVLKLKTGDKVHVRGHGTSILYGDPQEVYTTFSGYLMYFDKVVAPVSF